MKCMIKANSSGIKPEVMPLSHFFSAEISNICSRLSICF